jgi:dynein heavy chain
MRALRDFNLPKIVSDDVNIFMRLIKDLFPSTDPPRKMNKDLEKASQDVAKNELGLYVDKGLILKCV